MNSRISAKGQVTVPAAIREELGLEPGTVVVFELKDGGAWLRKGSRGDHPVDKVYGTLDLERSVDELLDDMRGARP